MKLKFLAISDAHLGESTSVLCYPEARNRLWEVLAQLLGQDAEVEELILLGDIPDRTLSSTRQIASDTHEFMRTVGSALRIAKIVYVPGNHDHTLWSAYNRESVGTPTGITALSGEPLVVAGSPVRRGAALEQLLYIFFGYPQRTVWRSLAERTAPDFWIANPVYAQEFKGRAYLFAHGTHFRGDVELPLWVKKLADAVGIDTLAGLDLKPGRAPRDAQSFAQLEDFITPFVDSLWPSAGNNPVPMSDELWYLLTRLGGKFGTRRPIPPDSRCFASSDLVAAPANRIHRLIQQSEPNDKSVVRAQKHFLPLLVTEAAKSLLPDSRTFVYGDTHRGGFGELQQPQMRIYNTGSWVVHNENDHPPCHLFAVDQEGEEYLLDVSFKDIPLEGGQLLEVAAREAEHKKARISRSVRALVDIAASSLGGEDL